jgi:nitroimidazol reductase NimA-like FMN-containing flavoprotein (pyridoxamine 5'-phosphate oxidase superfamily)
MSSFALSRSEAEKFLADLHVGVFSVSDDRRGPITVPLWYLYEPGGDILLVTPRTSRKIPLVQAIGRASFCVQDERPPFRYVSVEGPATVETVPTEPYVLQQAVRYLGRARGEAYTRQTADYRAEEVLVRIRPARWFSADFESLIPPA